MRPLRCHIKQSLCGFTCNLAKSFKLSAKKTFDKVTSPILKIFSKTNLWVLVWESMIWDYSSTTLSLSNKLWKAVINFKQKCVNLATGIYDKVLNGKWLLKF